MTTPDPTLARRLDLASDGALSVKAAAAFSGIGRTELYRLMGEGRLAFARHGAKRLVFRKSLLEYLAARVVVAGEVRP